MLLPKTLGNRYETFPLRPLLPPEVDLTAFGKESRYTRDQLIAGLTVPAVAGPSSHKRPTRPQLGQFGLHLTGSVRTLFKAARRRRSLRRSVPYCLP